MRPDAQRVQRGVVATTRTRVVVGVRHFRAQDQWHAVMAWGFDGEAPRCLHLADDLDLREHALDDPRLGWSLHYAWVELPVEPEVMRVVAQACRQAARRVATHGQTVRYSIRHELGRFDPHTGEYKPAQGERGLTCATCVLALCRGAGLELLEVATWPTRLDDAQWIERVVAHLRKKDPQHADAVAQDGLCARFRPTEVVGACLSTTLPAPFAHAVTCGEALRERYEDFFPTPPAL